MTTRAEHPDDAREPDPVPPLRVLDLGTQVAGPFAATLLGDLGAEVIKCEQPGTGDPIRLADGLSPRWQVEGRNKRSITLNLRVPEGQAIARRLAQWADVLVENFRPGTMAQWGLDYDTLREANPRLVYVSVSGFGQTGPRRSEPGYDPIGAAFGGLMAATGGTTGRPVAPGLFVVDHMTGMLAAVGALEAVRRRDAPGGTGRGEWVDVALYESVLRLAGADVVFHSEFGTAPPRPSPRVYRTRDQRWLCVYPVTDLQFARLAALTGIPALAATRFATLAGRQAHRAELDELLDEWIAAHDLAPLLEGLNAAEVPASPVNDTPDLLADEHIETRHALTQVPNARGATVTMPTPVPRLTGAPGHIRWSGEPLGASNARVYEELLGLTAADCDRLRASGVI